MPTLDDEIARHLRESEAAGELQAAPSYGKPLDFGDGYDETPVELRMGFKVLKDAGVVPHEVQMLREVGALKLRLQATADEAEAAALRQRINDLQQNVALRLEKLRVTGRL
jgi:hypothetical protein